MVKNCWNRKFFFWQLECGKSNCCKDCSHFVGENIYLQYFTNIALNCKIVQFLLFLWISCKTSIYFVQLQSVYFPTNHLVHTYSCPELYDEAFYVVNKVHGLCRYVIYFQKISYILMHSLSLFYSLTFILISESKLNLVFLKIKFTKLTLISNVILLF